MKQKFKFLIKQSLNKKIKTKWFKLANIFLCIALICLINIDKIITFFGGDFESEKTIIVVDELNIYDTFEKLFNETNNLETKNYKLEKANEPLETLKEKLKDDNLLIVDIAVDQSSFIKASLISYNTIDTTTKNLITNVLSNIKTSFVATNAQIDNDTLNALLSPVNLNTITTNQESEENENKETIQTIVAIILILPCFFLITMLVQMIGAEVNDEKSTRSMEIIIANVSPKIHFTSKIISATAFVIIQALLLVGYSFIGLVVRTSLAGSQNITPQLNNIIQLLNQSDVVARLINALPILLILFVASFVSYAILSGVLASMTTSTEDFQQLQTPLMIVLVLGYYLAIMAQTFDGALFIKIMSYIPMLSFLVSPTLYIFEQISIIELAISATIATAFTFIIFKYGLRIYKVGILNYQSSKLWQKMLKSLKNKE